jgi:hypothetical protein
MRRQSAPASTIDPGLQKALKELADVILAKVRSWWWGGLLVSCFPVSQRVHPGAHRLHDCTGTCSSCLPSPLIPITDGSTRTRSSCLPCPSSLIPITMHAHLLIVPPPFPLIPHPHHVLQGRQLELLRDTHDRMLRSARSPVRSPGAAHARTDTLRTMAHLRELASHASTG